MGRVPYLGPIQIVYFAIAPNQFDILVEFEMAVVAPVFTAFQFVFDITKTYSCFVVNFKSRKLGMKGNRTEDMLYNAFQDMLGDMVVVGG